MVSPFRSYPLNEVMLIVGLAVIPTVIGHSILNISMRRFRGQVVTIINLSQPFFAGILAWLFFREYPHPVFLVAAALFVASTLLAVLPSRARGEAGDEAVVDSSASSRD